MEVVYKKSIYARVMAEIQHAEEQNKEIEKIILSEHEWEDVIMYTRCTGVTLDEATKYYNKKGEVFMCGVRLVKSIHPKMFLTVYPRRDIMKGVMQTYFSTTMVNFTHDTVTLENGDSIKFVVVSSLNDVDALRGQRFDRVEFHPMVNKMFILPIRTYCEK